MNPRDLDLRHLEALCIAADEGSFGRAAQVLGFSQSAISQQIGALERVVGAPLFDRLGGRRAVRLTPTGEVLVGHARSILERTVLAAQDVEAVLAGERGQISIGTFQSVSVRILPDVLASIRALRPNVAVKVVELVDDRQLYEYLLEDKVELSFVVLGEAPAGAWDSRELLIDPFVLVAARGDFDSDSLPIGELDGLPLIAEFDCTPQLRIERGLHRHGIEPNYVFRSNDNAALQAMVRSGLGSAIMPFLAVDRSDPGIRVHRLDPGIEPRRIALAWAQRHTPSAAASVVIDAAVETCRRLQADIPEHLRP